MTSPTQLKGFQNSQDATLSNILLRNLISFYDWGFLDKGGFVNVKIPSSGMYSGDKHKLQPVNTPNYQNGKAWQAFKSNWVWESGVTVGSPVSISGVYVNGTFRSLNNNVQPYYINYPQGQVIFNNPISASSNVTIEYSYKWLNVVPADDVPFFRQVQQFSNRLDAQFNSKKGEWVQLGETRVQTPALAIEVNPPKNFKGFQIGGGQWVHNEVVFYVVAETKSECSNLLDQITFQNDRTITLFDPNKIAESGMFPLNYRNELTASAVPSGMYPSLVENFKYRECYIFDSRAQGITQLSPDLYIGSAVCTTEVVPI
jgi:hypothetical protein